MDERDTTFTRKLARALQEELLALDEIEALLGELPPELVEQRDATQRKLDAIDRALIVTTRVDEADGA
jgi:hypothetical protein